MSLSRVQAASDTPSNSLLLVGFLGFGQAHGNQLDRNPDAWPGLPDPIKAAIAAIIRAAE